MQHSGSLRQMNTEQLLKELNQISAVNDTTKIEELIALLVEDRREIVREMVVDVLKRLKDPNLPEKIAALLHAQDAFVRNSAASILARQWDWSKEALVESLKDKDKNVRKLAIDALYEVGDPSTVDFISIALDDEDVNNVIAAVEYIGDLGGHGYAEKILQILSRAEDQFLICSCLEALAKIGDPQCLHEVEKRFSSPLSMEDFMLMPYLRLLAKFSQPQHLGVLLEIAEAKLNIAYKEIIDSMALFINRNKSSLKEHEKKQIHTFLTQAISKNIPSANKYEIVSLIGRLGAENLSDEVRTYLQSDDPMIRLGAIEVIGTLKMTDFEADLQALLEKEKDEDLRLAAIFTLEQLKGE